MVSPGSSEPNSIELSCEMQGMTSVQEARLFACFDLMLWKMDSIVLELSDLFKPSRHKKQSHHIIYFNEMRNTICGVK